tara:strand:+ start:4225 stop:4647 length:423 start_codon:yes stop_codon:yes gene_type:complete
MKKSELKNILKPLIKECIKEVIFEEGVLSGLITEVMKVTSNAGSDSRKYIVEQKSNADLRKKNELEQKNKVKLEETRKKMLNAVGKGSISGVNVFEGTQPLAKAGTPGASNVTSPLQAYDPGDSGVDISEFFNPKWKNMV